MFEVVACLIVFCMAFYGGYHEGSYGLKLQEVKQFWQRFRN